jgi:hypothetical protein
MRKIFNVRDNKKIKKFVRNFRMLREEIYDVMFNKDLLYMM